MTISFVLWVKPPTIGPMKLAYSPKIGLIPTRDAAAIPSGTEAAARGRPAIASSLIDSGRIECHQERSLPGEECQLVLEAAERGLVGEYVNDDHADGRQSDENQMCRRHALHGVPRSPVIAELREHNDEHKDQYPDGQDRCDDLLLTEFRLHLSRFGEHRFRHRVSAFHDAPSCHTERKRRVCFCGRHSAMMMLEREAELAKLRLLVDESKSSGGRVVLLRGEAGIGKSTLVNRFLSESQDSAHTLLGACDDLLTPQPLGPIWDIAREDSSLAGSLAKGDRRAVMSAVLDLLSRSLRPTVLVLEDTQWADEATLDLIKYLGRRIARANGILILTYRDGEVDADHPLRHVIGELPPQSLVRMPLEGLSPDAVASMIEEGSFDLNEILALTDGNPLFVSEIVASGVTAVPSSVRDSVLARVAKVSPESRRVLDLVSVVPGEAERSIIDEILDPAEGQLAECVRQGLLRLDDATLAFPHDLQRRAVESSLTASQRRRLNDGVLIALGADADPSRLVHHAREADDVDAIVQVRSTRGESGDDDPEHSGGCRSLPNARAVSRPYRAHQESGHSR
ncbi:MAG: AAA family ATPase [Actinomycetota bacterium]|nr:AAA family ATPase [Actinomycetota bacterium]